MNIKRFCIYLLIATIVATVCMPPTAVSAVSGSDWQAGRIMDDEIFYNKNSMSIEQIQQFLNSKVPVCDTNGTKPSEYGGGTRAQWGATHGNPAPYTCLKNYYEHPTTHANNLSGQPIPADSLSAAQIIYIAAQNYSINPQVLIVLLQKEQSLVTDEWPFVSQYRAATGNGCPDTAPCDQDYYGFYNQVTHAAWQFRRYADVPRNFNHIPGQNNFVRWSPNAACGGSSVYIQNQATASLYNYTPYQPNASALSNLYGTGDSCGAYGNRNFWRLFSDWFGPTTTDRCSYDAPGPFIASVDFRKLQPRLDWGVTTVYSGSGSNCVESHIWNQGFSSWNQNNASNFPTFNPADGVVKYADLDGDGRDEPVLVGLRNTGSGMVEFHVWNTSMKKWVVHAATNLPTASLANLAIDFADLDGDGKDEPFAFGYKDTSTGMVEFHYWSDGVATWKRHEVTNLPVIDPAKMVIGFGDMNGDGRDEAIAIGVANTGSGMVEFHVWNQFRADWAAHYASNLPLFNNNDAGITFADIDSDGRDEGVLVSRRNTGSGRIEFHAWEPGGFSTWKGHWATNLPQF